MDRSTIRAFSVGLLLATSVLGIVYYTGDRNQEYNRTFSLQQAKQLLQNEGYVTVQTAEYNQLLQLKRAEQEESTLPIKKESKDKATIVHKEIVIKPGMTSIDIASQLLESEIIKNSTEFNAYLTKRDLTTKIQLGTYTLSSDMTHEEIAAILTKNN
ncbi:endolytic transglycosylase MltG [Bacillus sp. CGMCC 1.16541]|uniref:endolytic transglycosylase MltG n=1 Tax=Bacillus sp. CGMCC 1.16541 TaxID=2185143 RepID=UPI001EF715FF|nr:endolytic transglycosylase MltG [Bacillus sp. CGMCC 1.16541]